MCGLDYGQRIETGAGWKRRCSRTNDFMVERRTKHTETKWQRINTMRTFTSTHYPFIGIIYRMCTATFGRAAIRYACKSHWLEKVVIKHKQHMKTQSISPPTNEQSQQQNPWVNKSNNNIKWRNSSEAKVFGADKSENQTKKKQHWKKNAPRSVQSVLNFSNMPCSKIYMHMNIWYMNRSIEWTVHLQIYISENERS